MTTTAEKVTEVTSASPEKRRALGRGLESLLPGPRIAASAPAVAETGPQPVVIGEIQAVAERMDQVIQIPLTQIDRNPYQTRVLQHDRPTHEGASTLAELADSIRVSGVIQPITVRPAENGRYVLITGERRWKASGIAGKPTVPAIVKQVSEQQAAEMTVVENLQRQDLNCWEQANAFARLSTDFGLTQEQIGKRVGLSRETVSNYMRILKLPDSVCMHIRMNHLHFSEARALLMIRDPNMVEQVAEAAVEKHLSVFELEQLVAGVNGTLVKEPSSEQTHRARWVDPNVRAAQRTLEQALGVKVRIRDRKGKGTIRIEYSTLEDFDRIVDMLKGK